MKENNIADILRKQYIFPLFDNEKLQNEYFTVYEDFINKADFSKFGTLNLFLLGVIWGKRIERNKRK